MVFCVVTVGTCLMASGTKKYITSHRTQHNAVSYHAIKDIMNNKDLQRNIVFSQVWHTKGITGTAQTNSN